jgi:hypothetical protein
MNAIRQAIPKKSKLLEIASVVGADLASTKPAAFTPIDWRHGVCFC